MKKLRKNIFNLRCLQEEKRVVLEIEKINKVAKDWKRRRDSKTARESIEACGWLSSMANVISKIKVPETQIDLYEDQLKGDDRGHTFDEG